MQTIAVNLPQHSYQIAIFPHGLQQLGSQLRQLPVGNKVLLVSNPTVFNYYGEIARQSLENAGFSLAVHLIPDGEQHKTLDRLAEVYDTALLHRIERSSTLIALGGGVIGDMTGFAAATWLRGVNFVQVPTTLLAMVDASIGGKTGVNHPQGKNLIGAFYQPCLVLIDPLTLKTLPPREFRAGMAEVIKYGVICDRPLFDALEQAPSLDSLEKLSPQLLETILQHSCQAKATIVSQDEKEAGLRAILNYGHTLGHAIESLTHYSQFLHGEAVAMGMVAAGEIARRLDLWTAADAQRQTQLIHKAQLPSQIPSHLKTNAILTALKTDKKVKDGTVRFVLPTANGQAIVEDGVTPEVLRTVLAEIGAISD
ncbi:MAG: 3-dehydroquinate synthase [Chloroflexaceae bacterium]|nr:3-dehydroquinate synthase [Chloroflexaceae bacterium]